MGTVCVYVCMYTMGNSCELEKWLVQTLKLLLISEGLRGSYCSDIVQGTEIATVSKVKFH